MAFCIFAFLPYCQLTAGHAAVDVFTDPLPARAISTMSATTADAALRKGARSSANLAFVLMISVGI